MASVANINDVLEGHVALEVECVDRLYLNAYVPNLQVGGQVVRFQCGHLGFKVPSTALFGRIGNRFRREVKAFAAKRGIPILALKKPDRSRWDDRKLDHVQATRAGLAFTALSNGFASTPEPDRLRALCDSFGPGDVQAFFDRWSVVIPMPLSAEDRAAGYWWELSMRQVEVSRTLVLDDPRRARNFFEALVSDNIGVGRSEAVSIAFAGHQVRKNRDEWFATRVFSPGTEVRIDFRYKHSRVKQYRKDGRALRIETVINNPDDLGVRRRLDHLPQLIAKPARSISDCL